MRLFVLLVILCVTYKAECKGRNILVFGGNGFLGASTVNKLLIRGDNVTIVNRGNWYWDTKQKIKPYVQSIWCDRQKYLSENCPEFVEFLHNKEFDKFDAVIDFSAYSDHEIKEALKLLKGKANLYIYVSTDSIYDACDPLYGEPVIEENGVRPTDPARRELLSNRHQYGDKKLRAEEELIEQRKNGGIPYVILRLPDVVGPRDSTYRVWIYLLWVKVAPHLPHKPVTIPKFLKNYDNSFVYVNDVSKIIEKITNPTFKNSEAIDQAFNLAWHDKITMEHFLRTIEKHLKIPKQKFIVDNDSSTMYLYPTVRVGTLNSTKAVRLLGWDPILFDEAIKETVEFYEFVMSKGKYNSQRDEIIQIQTARFYSDNKEQFYSTLEKIYNIDLSHFRPHDEL